MTYWAAHWQLRRDLGPARNHPCVDCGRPALDWSLSPWASNVHIGERISHGRTIPAAYSLNLGDYEPRCRACHTTLDNRTRKHRTMALAA